MSKKILSIALSLIIMLFTVPAFSLTGFAKSGYVARSTSDLGLKFIEAYEGYFQFAYWDYEHYTIGYGTTCTKDQYPSGISEPFAHNLLKQKLPSYESGLNSFLKKNNIYVTQNQYDALMSFTYNFGAYVWEQNPTIAKYLKNGIEKYTDKQIADAFGMWVKAGGQVIQGLVERRAGEAKFFCTPDFPYTYEMYVVKNSVTLRSGPSSGYSSTGSLKRGNLVCVNYKKYIGQYAWGRISSNGSYHWFRLDYAKYGNIESPDNSLISTCLYNVENVDGGIKLNWKKVNGADGYKIYRSVNDSNDFSLIKTVSDKNTVSYTDSSVSTKEYHYYVVAYNGDNDAPKSAISEITYVNAPTLSSLKSVDDGFKLTWKKQSNANGYQVLRRNEGDDTFVKLTSVGASTTSYTDKSAIGGIRYYYAIKSYDSKGLSGASNTKSGMFLATPNITGSTNTKNSITINFTKALGSKGYYIYRKEHGSNNHTKIATINSGSTTSYTDKNIDANKSYYYCVQSFTSGLNSDFGPWFLTKVYYPPKLISAENEKNGIKLTWEKAEAHTYNVYRRLSSNKNYSKIGSSSSTTYLDKTAKSNKKYYYKVTSVVDNCKESYKSNTKAAIRYGTTKILSINNTKKGLNLSFKKISGAKSYSVYKYSKGKYKLLGTASTNSFLDKTLGKSNSRTYAVVVNFSNASSSYSSKVKGYKIAKPKIKAKRTSKGILLSWKAKKNAKGIIVYRKTPGSKVYKQYEKYSRFSKTTYLNSSTKKGKKYSYKIKFINGKSESLLSNTVTKKR